MTDANIRNMDNELRHIICALHPYIRVAHAKDCKLAENTGEKHEELCGVCSESHTFRGAGSVELPAPGMGVLNYDLYLKLLGKFCPNIPLIIEHLPEADIPRAKAFVDAKLKLVGC